MPPPPDFASPPILWGTEEHVRDMFGAVATSFEFDRDSATIEWDSVEGFADYFMDRFGPMVTARRLLGERFQHLRKEVMDVWRRFNEAPNGTLRLPQEYLLSVIRL